MSEPLYSIQLRLRKHISKKLLQRRSTNQLKYEDLQDFKDCYNTENIHNRKETEQFKAFTYEELINRDKTNLDIFWLKDESLEEMENLPDPDIIASEIVENLEFALEQFQCIIEDLENK